MDHGSAMGQQWSGQIFTKHFKFKENKSFYSLKTRKCVHKTKLVEIKQFNLKILCHFKKCQLINGPWFSNGSAMVGPNFHKAFEIQRK